MNTVGDIRAAIKHLTDDAIVALCVSGGRVVGETVFVEMSGVYRDEDRLVVGLNVSVSDSWDDLDDDDPDSEREDDWEDDE